MKKKTFKNLIIVIFILLVCSCTSIFTFSFVFTYTLGFRGLPLNYSPIEVNAKIPGTDYTFIQDKSLNISNEESIFLSNLKNRIEISSISRSTVKNKFDKYSIIDYKDQKFIILYVHDYTCGASQCFDGVSVYELTDNLILPVGYETMGTCLDPVKNNNEVIVLTCGSESLFAQFDLLPGSSGYFYTFDLNDIKEKI
jgi:hypothetical protein